MPVRIPCLEDPSDLAVDTDLDGVADCVDNCPSTANEDQLDTDVDGAGDLCDVCPLDAHKSLDEGVCGCGVSDTDGDGDGAPDCSDGCPNDPLKVDAGICGCGVADVDTDGDGAFDCADGCPGDPAKTDAGACGCGVADTDSDGDGVADCEEEAEEDDATNEFLTLDDDEEPSPGEDQPAEGGSDRGSAACGAGAIGFMPVMLSALLLVGRSNRRGAACA
jgi:hypothetical protein